MGKMPYMQFYPDDWVRDTISLNAPARAAWIDIICFLWNCKTRGRATRTHLVWSGLVRLQPEVFSQVLIDMIEHDICDVQIDGGALNPADEDGYKPDDEVTITSRRMVREEIERENHRLAQARYAAKKAPDPRLILPDHDLIQTDRKKLRSQEAKKPEEEKIFVELALDSPPPPPVSFWKDAEEVMRFLNEKAGKRFPLRSPNGTPTTNLSTIQQRLKDGYTVLQCRQIIALKTREWAGSQNKDGKPMDLYLRPQTLFAKKNFETYVGELHAL